MSEVMIKAIAIMAISITGIVVAAHVGNDVPMFYALALSAIVGFTL